MRGLGDTTAMLARLRRQARTLEQGLQQRRRSSMAETTAFGDNPGGLRMFIHAPTGLKAGAALVIVLHGCKQDAETYATDAGWITLADRYGFVVVAAEQVAANNPNRCFNWFSPGDATRGQGEAASIAAMANHAISEYGLDRSRVFVTGLSAGGAMTAVMLATYPDLFAGGAVVAGLAYGVAENIPQALQVMHRADGRGAPELGSLVRAAAPLGGRVPRLSIWHGDADATVVPANADDLARQWAWTHGLAVDASEVRREPHGSRSVWLSPTTGEAVIELNIVRGMGHGAPLAASGPDGLGAAGPFMLEAGISSSQEILRFWGLATAQVAGTALVRRADETLQAAPAVTRVNMSPPTPPEAFGVQAVIERALRSAGLMR